MRIMNSYQNRTTLAREAKQKAKAIVELSEDDAEINSDEKNIEWRIVKKTEQGNPNNNKCEVCTEKFPSGEVLKKHICNAIDDVDAQMFQYKINYHVYFQVPQDNLEKVLLKYQKKLQFRI